MNNLLFILSSIIFFHIIKQSHTSKIKIISIPFKREIPKEINEKNIFEYLNNNIIQIIIDISNKHFKIPLNIKLRQYPFFSLHQKIILNLKLLIIINLLLS